jgi:2-(1,2-epoxy-1,2-dihydrophenyl)acetyl-CoA isomerase
LQPESLAAEEPVLLRSVEDSVLKLTLNRPAQLNALNWRMMRLLREALDDAAADPEVRAVVLTGAGRAFCSGGDLRGELDPDDPIANRSSQEPAWRSYEQRVAQLLRFMSSAVSLHEMPKPTIAMIRGAVAGAGVCLAAACDFRIVAEDAVFTTAFIHAARPGDFGGSYFLPRLVGAAKARELYMLGDKIDAHEAERIGLVTRLVTKDALETETFAFAKRLASGPSAAHRYIKRSLNLGETGSLRDVIEAEVYGMVRCSQTEDARELVTAMKEARAPVFKGY